MHEDEISRMQEKGLLSDRQADLLREAVEDSSVAHPAATPRLARRFLNILIISVLVIVLVILAILFFSSGTDPDPVQNISQTLNQPGSTGNMNRNLSASLGIALILILPLVVITWLYNGIVEKEEKTMKSWSQVEAAYQRRVDLIPALIETVSRYVKHEQKTLENISEARSGPVHNTEPVVDQLITAQKYAADLLRAQIGKTPIDEAMLADLTKAQALVGNSARQLLAIAESYPQLRASDQFLELQAQFEGTENRILTARNRFNEAVEDFNSSIRKLPGSLIANIGHFQRKAYFQADADSSSVPDRKWN